MSTPAIIGEAARLLQEGKLVAFPTETVYGLGADATNDAAVAAIFAAKGRPTFNPLISHVADIDAALAIGTFPAVAQKLAKAFWPGPLTVVVPRAQNCPVSLLASAGLPSIAVRVPQHEVARAILREVGRPVAAPSANLSGRISPTTAEHVRRDLLDKVALVVDGGAAQVGLESTVVSFIDDRPCLLRPGGVTRQAIEQVLGATLAEAHAGPLHAPGQLESHYAPRASLRLNVEQAEADEVYIGFGDYIGGHTLSASGDVVEAAANLFRLLHEIDAAGATHIAVAPIPTQGLGEAINDRLKRAAAPR